MAYDLEEQESLDQLKAWWEKWGTAVLSVITVGCLAFAAWNGWNWYQRYQGSKATIAYVQLQNAFVQGRRQKRCFHCRRPYEGVSRQRLCRSCRF